MCVCVLCVCVCVWLQGDLRGNWTKIILWLQGDLRDNWTKIIFYFLLNSNLFSVLSIKDNHFFSIIMHYLIPFIFLLLVQFHLFVIIRFIFFMENIFHKIILNIYFDHIYIMCLYSVFSVLCTGYILVYIMSNTKHWALLRWS